MLNVKANDFSGNVNQAVELEKAGCEIVRVTVPNLETVPLIPLIKEKINIPLVADIHFDYKVAIAAAEAGVDKIRINPGNIGSDDGVKKVVEACKKRNIPIRIGVNSGSIEKEILAKYGVTARALFESGKYHISLLEKYDFNDIVLSLKASNPQIMFDAYKMAAEEFKYPLHLGVTEAGGEKWGTIRSAAGIGGLLLYGIGNTIRVSLTDTPVKEIAAAKDILKATGIRTEGVKIVSCPTCGRTEIDLIGLAKKVEDALVSCEKNITVAIMGCVVNGPGEAKDAAIGVFGASGKCVVMKDGEVVATVDEEHAVDTILKYILPF